MSTPPAKVRAPARPTTIPGLLRRLLVFQFKLAVDGLRDVVLSPLSLVAVLWGVLFSPRDRGAPFGALLRFGRRTDDWIDLFELRRRVPDAEAAGADALVDAVERMLREEYARGGGLAGLQARLEGLRGRRSPDEAEAPGAAPADPRAPAPEPAAEPGSAPSARGDGS
ncbi:MAG: hypothetical protein V2J02_12755 [Pseudomonadales bacterium]|nr:hypothetical protein [Pseudomonadales bacterium]